MEDTPTIRPLTEHHETPLLNASYVIPRSIRTECLSVCIEGRKYVWFGGFGAVLTSVERGIKQGDIRMIGDIPFYVSTVTSRGWRRPRVTWTIPTDHISIEWMQHFRRVLFGCLP